MASTLIATHSVSTVSIDITIICTIQTFINIHTDEIACIWVLNVARLACTFKTSSVVIADGSVRTRVRTSSTFIDGSATTFGCSTPSKAFFSQYITKNSYIRIKIFGFFRHLKLVIGDKDLTNVDTSCHHC